MIFADTTNQQKKVVVVSMKIRAVSAFIRVSQLQLLLLFPFAPGRSKQRQLRDDLQSCRTLHGPVRAREGLLLHRALERDNARRIKLRA